MSHSNPIPRENRRRGRVILASRLFAPEAAAAAFRLRAAAKALTTWADVLVLTSKPAQAGAPSFSAPRVRTSRWPVLRDADGAVRGTLPYASFDVPLLARLLLAPRADAFLVEPPPTTGSVARIVGLLRRTPYVYYAADLVSVAAESGGHGAATVSIARRLERFALRGAAQIVTVNDAVAAQIERMGVSRSRIDVVGNGIDTDTFSPDGPAWRPPGVSADAPMFVYAGSMNELHGADVFVDAFATVLERLPNAVLVMVGKGEMADDIRRRAAEFPRGSVVVADAVPGERAAALLRGATAGLASVRPGSSYEFALATKALATASTGTAVIFAGTGPTATAVDEGKLGWAVPWRPDAVAEAMIEGAATPGTPADRAARSAWVSRHGSLDSVAQSVSAVLEQVAARRR